MSVRIQKRCTKCTTTFAAANCPQGCPKKHTRWAVIEDTKVDGKRRRRTVGTFATQREAEATRVESEDNDRRGHAVVASSMTLGRQLQSKQESR